MNYRQPLTGKVQVSVVGVGRFELPASCSQSRRANQAALHPV